MVEAQETTQRPKTRQEVIADYLQKYPIEEHADWYKTNLPDFYMGWSYAKQTITPLPQMPETAKSSEDKKELKRIIIILAIVAGFTVTTILLLFYFFGEALRSIMPF